MVVNTKRLQPAEPDADQLNAAWNDVVGGRTPFDSNDLVETVKGLHASAPDIHPHPTLRHTLKENIMQTALATPGSMSSATTPALDQPLREFQPEMRRASTRRLADVGSDINKWASIAAAVLIVLTVAAGAYLGGLYPGGNDSPGTYVAAPNFNAEGTPIVGTPEAGAINPESCLDAACLSETVFASALVTEGVDVSFARLQSWEVIGGVTVTFTEPDSELSGIGVDVVLEGAYQGTFTSATVITRANIAGTSSGGAVEYVPSNKTVELGQGDTVSYALGFRRAVVNLFLGSQLAVKTVSFYDGDLSAANQGASGVTNFRDNGSEATELPPELKAILQRPETSISFSYMTVFDSDVFPPVLDSYPSLVLGPVDGPRADNPGFTEGFVAWVSNPLG